MNLRRTRRPDEPRPAMPEPALTARDLRALVLIGGAGIVTARGTELHVTDTWDLDALLETLADVEALG